jgi:hypothetical protein
MSDRLDFDVFSGRLDQEPLWLATAGTLDEARSFMLKRAATSPGRYFVFCVRTNQVLSETDTTANSGSRHSTSCSN